MNHRISGSKSLLSRRELLTMTGGLTASYFIGGCGGGNGSSSVPIATGGKGIARTKVAGALKDQVNQFSLASDQVAIIWEGQSASISDFHAFAMGGNRSRSASDSRLMFQSVWYGLQGLRSGYERLANGLLAEDDQGYVAETVTTNNNLAGSSRFVNPQWLAAMMLQTYSAMRVTGALMKILQIAGIQQMQDWVTGQPTDADRLIAYGILADTFNSWLDTTSIAGGTFSLSNLKLDVSNAVTPQSVSIQIARIATILDAVPYTPGLRAGGNANGIPDDAMLTGPAASNFALSFLGTLAKLTLAAGALPADFPVKVNPAAATYNLASRLGASGLVTQIDALTLSAANSQTRTDALIQQLMTTALPAAASCTVQMSVGGYGLVVSIAQAILSEHSLVGDAIAGDVALKAFNDEISAIQACGSKPQLAILNAVTCDIIYLRSTHFIGGNTVTLRNLPVGSFPEAETDQISNTQVVNCKYTLCYPLANAGWKGTPLDGAINLYRSIIAGLPAPPIEVVRTFNNIEVSGAGLFFDLLRRQEEALKPDLLTNGQLIFCTTDFARALRRSPGATMAKVPAITSAALLCSAPNFIPAVSSSPMNLTTITTLPPLSAITDLVSGVPIHVQ